MRAYALAGESEQAVSDAAAAVHLGRNRGESFSELLLAVDLLQSFVIRLEQIFHIACHLGDHGERVVDLVGHAGRQATDGRQTVGLHDLIHQRPALRDVPADLDRPERLAGAVGQPREGHRDGNLAAVLTHQRSFIVVDAAVLLDASHKGCPLIRRGEQHVARFPDHVTRPGIPARLRHRG